MRTKKTSTRPSNSSPSQNRRPPPSRGGGQKTHFDKREDQGQRRQPPDPPTSVVVKVTEEDKKLLLRKPDPRKYGVVFYETLAEARLNLTGITQLAKSFDQLNIVIKAEGSMDEADLNAAGKLFCGAAWYLIHERRKMDGFYPA